MSEERYLVWSYEHGGWWRAGRMGYTGELGEAGRYTGVEAREIILAANRYGKEQMEVMVAEAAGPRFTEAALEQALAEIAGLKELVRRAAEALEHSLPMKQYAFESRLPYYDLIGELREAAE